MNKVQQEKIAKCEESATGEECKMKTLQRVKVQHEIVQYIKRVQHEKQCNMKRLPYKKVHHGNRAVRKKCNLKKCKLPQ